MRIKICLDIPNNIIELMNDMRDEQGVEYKQQIEEAIKLYHIDFPEENFPIENIDEVLKEENYYYGGPEPYTKEYII